MEKQILGKQICQQKQIKMAVLNIIWADTTSHEVVTELSSRKWGIHLETAPYGYCLYWRFLQKTAKPPPFSSKSHASLVYSNAFFILLCLEMDNIRRPLLIDAKKYRPQPYYSNPQLHPDDKIEFEKEAYENELKQYPFHEDLVRMAATGNADRWQHVYERHFIGGTVLSLFSGHVFSRNFFGKLNCRRLFFTTTIKAFFILQALIFMGMTINERFQIQNKHKYKQPNEETRHYQELSEKYNMYQDVEQIKKTEWPTRKDFNKKLSDYNERVRAKRDEFLIDKLRNA